MADSLAVDTWEGQGVRLGEVAGALSDLRRRSASRSPARTAVMTIAVVAESDEGFTSATGAIHALAERHPARVLLIRPEPDRAASLDARAALYSVGTREHPVAFEEVTLAVGGQAALHLDSVIDTFTLADLPVVTWYVDSAPSPSDSLLNVSGAVVLDSRDVGDPLVLRRMLEVSRRRPVIDLSWVRLEPVRDLLAGLFDAPAIRPYARAVTSAVVRGKPGPRHMLGGWLMAQLGLRTSQLTLIDARHVEITLEAHLDNETGTFDVGRIEARRALWAGATVTTGPSPRQVLPLPDRGLTPCLAVALTRLEGDCVWERALSAAASLAV